MSTTQLKHPRYDSDTATTGGHVPSDARLVEDARRGDEEAFRDLVMRYERRLIGTIHHIVQDRELAEDLAQDTFLRAFRSLDQFDSARRFGPWLFRIGVNITYDHARKQKRRRRWFQFSQSADDGWDGPSIPDPRKQKDLQQDVRAVIEQIPEKYRQVLVLRDLDNFSTSDIAAILDRKEATIRWRLAEARTRFANLWMERQAEENSLAV